MAASQAGGVGEKETLFEGQCRVQNAALQLLFHNSSSSSSSPDASPSALRSSSSSSLVVAATCGANGVILATADPKAVGGGAQQQQFLMRHCPAAPLPPGSKINKVTGAGDTFLACVVSALTNWEKERGDPKQVVCTPTGCRRLRPKELLALKAGPGSESHYYPFPFQLPSLDSLVTIVNVAQGGSLLALQATEAIASQKVMSQYWQRQWPDLLKKLQAQLHSTLSAGQSGLAHSLKSKL